MAKKTVQKAHPGGGDLLAVDGIDRQRIREYDRLCTGAPRGSRRPKPLEKRCEAPRRSTPGTGQIKKLGLHAVILRDMGDRFVSAWKRAEKGEVFGERIERCESIAVACLPTSSLIGNRSARGETLNDRRRTNEY
jgi:hypothetical protein